MDKNLLVWIEARLSGLSESEIKRAITDGVDNVKNAGASYGCYCDLAPDESPDGCVLDSGYPSDCVYATKLVKEDKTKWDCSYWRKLDVSQS